MRRTLLISVVLPWLAAATPALPQALVEPATANRQAILVADQVFITPERQLVASGGVEVFQGEVRLQAEKITFDDAKGQLKIEGPIRIDQDGEVSILADAAELDSDLQNGILSSARLVFNQQVQLAALQATRVRGRYTQLYKTAVTSCDVCDDGRPPLWQIRAERVTHDQEERQIYLEGAQLRVRDVPVFYLPALRLPDPTLDRATGFLVPSLRTTSNLATGVKVPYFFKIGDHKDLTVAPYVSSKTRTLDWRYRQAFQRGTIQIDGAFTRDDLQPDQDRGYAFLTGRFDLNQGYKLAVNLRTVSDDAYFADYGLADVDRLRSDVILSRIKRDEFFRGGFIHYKTLRDSEDQDEVPSIVADLVYERRIHPLWSKTGEFRYRLETHAHRRESEELATALDPAGRDIGRFSLDVNWRQDWRFNSGVVAEWQAGAAFERFAIEDDAVSANNSRRAVPRTALTFRLPMTRTTGNGSRQFLEPIAQVSWSNLSGEDIPNDESNFVEFDQGNLLSLSRFPASDKREDGLQFAYGVNWAHFAQSGWQASATVGQIYREEAESEFTKTSGLGGTTSDILLAGQIKLNQGIALTARGLLNGSFNFSKAELRGDVDYKRASFRSSYLWLGTDADEGRTDATSELWFDGQYEVNSNWAANANLRYDVSDGRATRAGLGLAYQNECVTVDLSVNRRYTSTTSVDPSTDFGFSISLNGFSVNSGTNKYRRSCSKT
ncbi:LPS assembly protein LptD [Epibacterium sp. SM1979]|uniref:LPS-assembly protein LptD n=1 Tax=Tritonibacter litoralis TaxID=2662264 RepID=A0A843YDE4_9RHOB|nr:LPS assembly protein LptD [Tritonibacter litoralis]MQQ07343.1 LPS assembly protein LptD [Tritonibacter litoralis]